MNNLRLIIKILLLLTYLLAMFSYAENLHSPVTKPIPINDIEGFKDYPSVVQQLIEKAQVLTRLNLTYLYNSNDPKKGGMDCSGTINHLLSQENLTNIPRQADEFYKWVWQEGKFYAVNSNNFNSFEFSHLKPGDLLFWTGTYKVKRDPPITHVMIYLGKTKQGDPIMFGASDGRTYQNKSMWGVSVFDFKLPQAGSASRFIGYSCIPHLTCEH